MDYFQFTVTAAIPNREIVILKIFRDFFSALDTLVEKMTTLKSTYGIGLKEVMESGFGDPQSLNNLVKVLPPEKLGNLLIVVTEITSMSNDLSGFTSYDTEQLTEFRKKLSSVVDKLNNVVRGL